MASMQPPNATPKITLWTGTQAQDYYLLRPDVYERFMAVSVVNQQVQQLTVAWKTALKERDQGVAQVASLKNERENMAAQFKKMSEDARTNKEQLARKDVEIADLKAGDDRSTRRCALLLASLSNLYVILDSLGCHLGVGPPEDPAHLADAARWLQEQASNHLLAQGRVRELEDALGQVTEIMSSLSMGKTASPAPPGMGIAA